MTSTLHQPILSFLQFLGAGTYRCTALPSTIFPDSIEIIIENEQGDVLVDGFQEAAEGCFISHWNAFVREGRCYINYVGSGDRRAVKQRTLDRINLLFG